MSAGRCAKTVARVMAQSNSFAGRRALVVGGTNGIGRGMCGWFATHQASTVVAGRSKDRGAEVVAEMKAAQIKAAPEGAAAGASPDYSFMPIDCFLVEDVRRFAKSYMEEHKTLDYLVISAGISTFQGRTETKEGLDQKLAIHYYTRVALIKALMPLLESTADTGRDVRVMSVLSGGVHKPYRGYAKDPELKTDYSLGNAADAAGFYNDIALESLALEHPKISFSHVAPGFVDTAWGSTFSPLIRAPMWVLKKLFAKSPGECADKISVALTESQYKGGFHAINQNKPAKVTPLQAEARETVWAHTLKVLDRIPS